MEYNHAKELLNMTFCNLILFNGEPVWLKDITDIKSINRCLAIWSSRYIPSGWLQLSLFTAPAFAARRQADVRLILAEYICHFIIFVDVFFSSFGKRLSGVALARFARVASLKLGSR